MPTPTEEGELEGEGLGLSPSIASQARFLEIRGQRSGFLVIVAFRFQYSRASAAAPLGTYEKLRGRDQAQESHCRGKGRAGISRWLEIRMGLGIGTSSGSRRGTGTGIGKGGHMGCGQG